MILPFPFQLDVSSKYGASMGRPSAKELVGKVYLRRVRLVDGDYDEGGAYWGGLPELPIYCAWNEDGAAYLRAANRESAKVQFTMKHNVRFYR